jgi:hypothetical protein
VKARTRSWISSRGSWRRGPHCRSSLLLNGGDDAPRGSAVRCLQILATSLRSVPILNSSKYLEVENLGVARGGRRNESSVKEPEDSIANVGKLGFDLGSVGTNHGDVALVALALLLLLDDAQEAWRCSAFKSRRPPYDRCRS